MLGKISLAKIGYGLVWIIDGKLKTNPGEGTDMSNKEQHQKKETKKKPAKTDKEKKAAKLEKKKNK